MPMRLPAAKVYACRVPAFEHSDDDPRQHSGSRDALLTIARLPDGARLDASLQTFRRETSSDHLTIGQLQAIVAGLRADALEDQVRAAQADLGRVSASPPCRPKTLASLRARHRAAHVALTRARAVLRPPSAGLAIERPPLQVDPTLDPADFVARTSAAGASVRAIGWPEPGQWRFDPQFNVAFATDVRAARAAIVELRRIAAAIARGQA